MAYNDTDVSRAVHLDGVDDYLTVSTGGFALDNKMWAVVVMKEVGNLGDWMTLVEVAGNRGLWMYNANFDMGFNAARGQNGAGVLTERPFIVHVISHGATSGTEYVFVNGALFREVPYTSSTSSPSITLGRQILAAPSKWFQGWIGRLQVGDIPSGLGTLLSSGDFAGVARYLQDTPWLESPSHHWELGESLDDQIGSWDFMANGSPEQVDKDMWKAPDNAPTNIYYPQATVLEAELFDSHLEAELHL